MKLQCFFVYPQLCEWSFLTTWRQLEELHLWTVHLDGDFRLELPNLKVFQVKHVFGGVLTLDAPQLTQLRIDAFSSFFRDKITLVHLETVESL